MDRVVYNCPNPTPGARAIVTMVYYTLEYTIRNVSQKRTRIYEVRYACQRRGINNVR